ncbi:sugar transport protein [Aspergillus sclerotioniger CBS 115572]|uniref:Sugar transport protein n=1 Tax=Aspergillus sclerotioniger CBS 115572 TaxID=1450535 RepID=A0A317W8L9_9EURO|nr:sugar transport protein [Aspergillus sclerotioniger CBS 115572]PWY81647.1 sugar transport protein [Aspergillus sclerotioniger CBS 115572]
MASRRSQWSRMLVFTTCLLAVSAFNYGFSDQAFASCQAMDSFERQFGVYHPTTGKYKVRPMFTSLYNSLKAATQIIGVFIGGYISNTYGRKICIFSMNLYALASAAVVVSSTTDGQILAGRALHYIYLGMQMAVIPTTLAELAPRNVRGAMGVLYWLSIKIGGLVVTGIARGTSSISTNTAWRIPFGLILVIPFICIFLVWIMPESPRWLLLRDRQEDAFQALKRYRSQNTPESEIQEDFDELAQKVAAQMQKKKFKDLFTPKNRERTFVVVAANFFQQASGQAFASQYGTLFVKQLKSVNPFSVTLGTNAVDIGALIISTGLSDQVGRRMLFHTSGILETAALMTMGGLGTADSKNVAAKEGIVAMLLLYSFGWSLAWAPLVYVLGAELPSAPLREMTLQIAYTMKLVTEFAVTFSYPYLETANDPGHVDIGGKLGFIYGSLSAVSVIFGYFFIPETRRMELEDIDKKYDSSTDSEMVEKVEYQLDSQKESHRGASRPVDA